MAATRPIERDPLTFASDGDRATLRTRARGIRQNQRPTVSNALGNAIAGTKARRGPRGGKFTPRAVSGML